MKPSGGERCNRRLLQLTTFSPGFSACLHHRLCFPFMLLAHSLAVAGVVPPEPFPSHLCSTAEFQCSPISPCIFSPFCCVLFCYLCCHRERSFFFLEWKRTVIWQWDILGFPHIKNVGISLLKTATKDKNCPRTPLLAITFPSMSIYKVMFVAAVKF